MRDSGGSGAAAVSAAAARGNEVGEGSKLAKEVYSRGEGILGGIQLSIFKLG